MSSLIYDTASQGHARPTYSIIFCKFPDDHKQTILQSFPKTDNSIMSHHKSLIEARDKLRQHAIDFVSDNCGRVKALTCEINEPNMIQIQSDGIYIFAPTCDMIELYESKPIISEGFVYNSYHTMRRMIGWMEILYDACVPIPPQQPQLSAFKNGEESKECDTTYIDVISELREKFESGEIILRCVDPSDDDESCDSYDSYETCDYFDTDSE